MFSFQYQVRKPKGNKQRRKNFLTENTVSFCQYTSLQQGKKKGIVASHKKMS